MWQISVELLKITETLIEYDFFGSSGQLWDCVSLELLNSFAYFVISDSKYDTA